MKIACTEEEVYIISLKMFQWKLRSFEHSTVYSQRLPSTGNLSVVEQAKYSVGCRKQLTHLEMEAVFWSVISWNPLQRCLGEGLHLVQFCTQKHRDTGCTASSES